jgi:hypothetical protein
VGGSIADTPALLRWSMLALLMMIGWMISGCLASLIFFGARPIPVKIQTRSRQFRRR